MADGSQHRYIAHAWVEREGAVLVMRRRLNGYLGGQWDIPGGQAEPGEAAADAAVRETAEEAGLRVSVTRELSHYENWDTEGERICFHTVTFRVAESDRPLGEVRLLDGEHDEYIWLTPAEMLSLDLVWHVRRTVEHVRLGR
ncbi:MAG TPA: NUDIX hydrolase [Conexibacter sp.]|jgi:8-oxo-dGTP diphosphatase